MSQLKQLRKALESGEKLTGMDILNKFNCMNYKGRIADLRAAGVPIATKMVKLHSRKRVALYYIPMKPKQTELFTEKQ